MKLEYIAQGQLINFDLIKFEVRFMNCRCRLQVDDAASAMGASRMDTLRG